MGYDAGKRVKGRKAHALVDVEGLPMRVIVHSAGIQDRDGAALVLDKIRQRFPWLELVWADSGSNAHQVEDAVARSPGLRLEIVKRAENFGWFLRNNPGAMAGSRSSGSRPTTRAASFATAPTSCSISARRWA